MSQHKITKDHIDRIAKSLKANSTYGASPKPLNYDLDLSPGCTSFTIPTTALGAYDSSLKERYVYSSILGKYINPATGEVVETPEIK